MTHGLLAILKVLVGAFEIRFINFFQDRPKVRIVYKRIPKELISQVGLEKAKLGRIVDCSWNIPHQSIF